MPSKLLRQQDAAVLLFGAPAEAPAAMQHSLHLWALPPKGSKPWASLLANLPGSLLDGTADLWAF